MQGRILVLQAQGAQLTLVAQREVKAAVWTVQSFQVPSLPTYGKSPLVLPCSVVTWNRRAGAHMHLNQTCHQLAEPGSTKGTHGISSKWAPRLLRKGTKLKWVLGML